MSFDDELRAHQEHLRLGMTQAGRKYLDPAKLAEDLPEPQPATAPADTQLTSDDFLRAEIELAEQHGTGHGAVRDLVMLTHQRAGLGYSDPERVAVINQVAVAMRRGMSKCTEEQIVALSGRPPVVGTFGYADADEVALTGGTTSETRARRAARSSGQDSADAVIARHPELAHLFKAGRTSDRKHPARSGRPITTATRAHRSDLDVNPQDTDQPAEGGDVHAKIDKYLRMREEEFGGEDRDAGSHGTHSYGPKSAAEREAGERRSLAGGRPGDRSIPDLARGSARTRSSR